MDKLMMSVDFRGSLLAIAPAGAQVRQGRLADVQLAAEHADATAVHLKGI